MHKENNLFKMLVKVREQHKTHPVNAEAAFATAERLESWETWHKRFRHVSYSGLQRLLEANLVEGFKVDTQTPQPDCIACTEAKHAEEPYKKKVNRDTMPGELTHIDLWGKYDVTSINRHQYFILFVDDCSGMTRLRTRLEKIKELKVEPSGTQDSNLAQRQVTC
jgi:hypothetical protein